MNRLSPESGAELANMILFLVPVAGTIGLFTMLAVVGWAKERRREREAFYRHETARKLVEQGKMTYEQFDAFSREEAERPIAARGQALTLAGVVLALGGLGAIIALRKVDEEPLSHLGFIPFLIGTGLVLFGSAASRRRKPS